MSAMVQDPTTPAFKFGVALGTMTLLGGLAFLAVAGRKGNAKYTFGPAFTWNKTVLLWRLAAVIFCCVTFSQVYGAAGEGANPLNMFTMWNWLLLSLYFLAGLVVSCVRSFRPEMLEGEKSLPTKILFTLHQLMGEIEVPASHVVFIIVWFYLAPVTANKCQEVKIPGPSGKPLFTREECWAPFLEFYQVATHAVNVVLMVIDFLVSGYTFNPFHFVSVTVWSAAYLLFHIARNQSMGLLAYPFLATNDNMYIAWVFGLSMIGQVFFWMYYHLGKFKAKVIAGLHSDTAVDNDNGSVKSEDVEFPQV